MEDIGNYGYTLFRTIPNCLAISVIPIHTIFGVFPSKIFWNENTPIL